MYGSHRMCNVQRTNDQEQIKLQKIKELTNILKDTDKNLTICEEILATYIRKRLKICASSHAASCNAFTNNSTNIMNIESR
ncbi:uncharacterized protein LOC114253970 isoform X2 [Monomorium pharaonis]|uniref:uncharacterized protein LOC114253970 isoform X2 n=1 Tax=Monomorium pharaonis TaxID=307658 RepID=UPI00102E1D41|nr:uncharacterized protein LOC114253970 isoform X2 [Monomorium pharaonis]